VQEAFRWTPESGMVGLGDLPGGIFRSAASAVSADGLVVVGDSDSAHGQEAFRWTAAGGMQGLGSLPGGSFGTIAYAANADGSVIVGEGTSSSGLPEAFRWTQAGGMRGLNNAGADFVASTARGVSADGSVVVGTMTSLGGTQAFLWTPALGMTSLKAHLLSLGVAAVQGWTLENAFAVSADGTTVVGYGFDPQDRAQGWVARIRRGGAGCRVDLDGDGQVSIQDLLAYLAAYAAGDQRTDVNGDGLITVQDFLAFLAAYAAGC
jgi:probable HAF family extracellular repeat protein